MGRKSNNYHSTTPIITDIETSNNKIPLDMILLAWIVTEIANLQHETIFGVDKQANTNPTG